MRITAKEAAAREAFMLKLFGEDPSLSGPKANAKLKKEFGSAMRMARVYELRTQAIEQKKAKAGTTAPVEAKGVTRAGRQPANGESPFPFFMRTDPGEGDVLEHSLKRLREAGLSNLKVESHGSDWAVINTES